MKKSLRDSINLKCKDCNYDELDKGTWRQQVESCTSSDCPLFDVRSKSYTLSSEIMPKRPNYQTIDDAEGVRCGSVPYASKMACFDTKNEGYAMNIKKPTSEINPKQAR